MCVRGFNTQHTQFCIEYLKEEVETAVCIDMRSLAPALLVLLLLLELATPMRLMGTRGSIVRLCAEGAAAVPALVSWREEDDPEEVVPDVSLTRSRDGSTGTATFSFSRPRCIALNNVWDNGMITGLWLRDEEGTLSTPDLEVIFEKGKPIALKAILVLKSRGEWERFMRFMERYAKANDLDFVGSGDS